MQLTESPRAEGISRLYELMLRVNSSTDLSEVLDEIARGVVEVLGYGIAAIARLEGETFVMTTVAGPEEVREQIIGRRTPVASIFNEFAQADEWGVLRFVPHDRMPDALEESAWVPDFEPGSAPTPGTRSTRSTPRSTPPPASCSATCRWTCPPATGSRSARSASSSRCSSFRPAWRCTTPSSASGSATRSGWATCCASVSSAGQLAELDLSLREAAQAIARGPADRAPLDPLLPLRRPRPGRAVGGVPARTTVSPAASSCSSRACWPAVPGSSAGRS